MSHADALTQAEIIDMLRLHQEAGCTDVLADAPVDRFAAETTSERPVAAPHASGGQAVEAAPPAALQESQAAPVARPVAPAATPQNTAASADLAAAADSLEALQAAMQQYDGCPLKATAKNTVFCDGVAGAKIMLVGEAPGQDEDRQGKPFVGRSGQLLDAMLAAIGLSRDSNLYISNVVPWRPPGNRTPTPDEIALCEPFIRRHIELAKPDLLLLVGNISNKTLLGTQTGITKLRGTWQSYDPDGLAVKTLPLLHPAYVLRRPETKAAFWADLCALKKQLPAA